ncbi:type I-E CRISPR-associated protein Cse2/CasB [Streptomyces sp. Amel2xC10]|uniref:type I-E CRISPR-associated protein Cse2/CasB n=1 Tax=Streptomyces sp. Amel2xC10 TaxID=1305826 RepID=UPI000A085841|nr:type I-E CRISPR-associated protein Cse2/CasB [Streptomyces sp. Amel2xC10]SME92244.1 CRISPR-associated protein, Cse2 family [Streptomyces sp. Amel2xC10]
MTTTPATVRKRVAHLAASQISFWQEGYLRDSPTDVAALARLRRGAGRSPGDLPDLWTLIDTSPMHTCVEGQPPLREDQLVRAENALHASLTLWALHQQSRSARMHRPHRTNQPGGPGGLGAAVRRLMPPDGIDEPVRKRLVRAGTAPDVTSLSQRLRDLVVLLRRADIPLDYGLLTGQLYVWQQPGGPAAVRREWGSSFHSWVEKTAQQPDNSADLNFTDGSDKDAQ